MEKALFAAGCFWGVQAAFKKIPGVIRTTVGYTGGHLDNPSYHDVCSGNTGHAEAVLVEFDPKMVSFEKLLDVFWSIHNPTTLNRQGVDVGTQYRSAIFFQSKSQEESALLSKKALSVKAVTEIVPAGPFWQAEDYHQCYLEKRGGLC